MGNLKYPPSEFWIMSPQEFWLILDMEHEKSKIGSLERGEIKQLMGMLEED